MDLTWYILDNEICVQFYPQLARRKDAANDPNQISYSDLYIFSNIPFSMTNSYT